MDFYFYMCGILFILTAFGVFESILKICKINRFGASLFFLMNLILYLFSQINIFEINFNLNVFLYILICFLQFFKKNSFKNILGGVLVCFVTIAVLVCYKATGFVNELVFVIPLVYVAFAVGVLMYFVCKSFSCMFSGIVIGSICYEVVTFDLQKFVAKDFVFFDTSITTYILCGMLSYCLIFAISAIIKDFKLKKEQKNLIN